jgi:3-phosphoshikimate 1-carboxyvinyltransferase
MENITVRSVKKLSGEITLPGDKSISHRAAIFSAMAYGVSRLSGYLTSGDCLATLHALMQLGVPVEGFGKSDVRVHGVGPKGFKPPQGTIDLCNSGTGMRLLAGILAGQHFASTLTGDDSLRKRPMQRIMEPLSLMGACIEGYNGSELPPLSIRGADLRGITYRMPVASAQVKSALLLAGLTARGDTTIIQPAHSRDHTERMMRYLGIQLETSGLTLTVRGGQEFQAKDMIVPGDLSSAAFPMVLAALKQGSSIKIKHVCLNPTRTAILNVLKRMGTTINITMTESPGCFEPVGDITVKGSALKGTVIAGSEIPNVIDEIPILAVAAAMAEGKTEVRDAKELRVKETDRIAAICNNLRQLGAAVTELPDGFVVEGPVKFTGGRFRSFGDHRIAMSMIVAGYCAEGETAVDDTACIDTSFPGFMETMSSLMS